MKVNNDANKTQLQNLQNQPAGSKKTENAKATEAKPQLKTDLFNVTKANSNESASIDLSNRAQDMKKAKELATKAPDVREDKIKKLQEMIDAGTYKVDAKKVADKLVNEELMNAASTEG